MLCVCKHSYKKVYLFYSLTAFHKFGILTLMFGQYYCSFVFVFLVLMWYDVLQLVMNSVDASSLRGWRVALTSGQEVRETTLLLI